MKIVCWYPMLDHLQLTTQRELARIAEVTTVIAREQMVERKKQGWAPEDVSDLAPISLDGADWWRRGLAVLREHADAIHLFNTMWTDPRFLPLIVFAAARGRRIGLITEPYSDTVEGYFAEQSALQGRFLRALRPRMYRTARLALGRRMGPIFAISPKAVRQFAAAGFDPAAIYPYGYFVRNAPAPSTPRQGGPLRVIYVGALIARKGIDCAVEAVHRCRARGVDVVLDLYGSGTMASSDGVTHRGTIPVGTAPAVMAGYDLLLLPSRYDGWGAVVNEALQQGVPAIVSSNAGASALVASSGAGAVFAPDDVEQLAAQLAGARANISDWRARAIAYRDRLDPSVAARYVRDCLDAHLRGAPAPACPWY